MHISFANVLQSPDMFNVMPRQTCAMKTRLTCPLMVAAQLSLAAFRTSGHPGSGIVVDAQGNVYFTYIQRGVAKIDSHGKLTYVGHTRGGHWLCLDPEGSFSRTQPKHFERITPDGVKPALIYADGGSPIAVLRDGLLYYASNDEQMTPGGLQVTRQTPGGAISIFPPDGKKTTEKLGITGLAPGPDGSLYIASPSAVTKLKMDGTFAILAQSIELKDCDVDYPDNDPRNPLPYLRGLAVDGDGTVFAAGCGCHALVKIKTDGKVETALKAERPWAPTGVAVHRGDVYILEYTNANGSPYEGWRPRVRKLERDGKVTTLFTAPAER
jgi:sugar lactone lactonase YvrE